MFILELEQRVYPRAELEQRVYPRAGTACLSSSWNSVFILELEQRVYPRAELDHVDHAQTYFVYLQDRRFNNISSAAGRLRYCMKDSESTVMCSSFLGCV